MNLTVHLGTPTDAALVEKVVVVLERDTVSQVTTAPARLEGVTASLSAATKKGVGREQVATLE